MGADLYINKLRRPVQKEWQPKFDAAVKLRDRARGDSAKEADAQKLVDDAYENLHGDEHYFRDSYNGTAVLWLMGLSWWNDLNPDVRDNDEINCSPELCREFLRKVQSAEFELPVTRKDLTALGVKVDNGENSLESWRKYYTEKRQQLIAFLERAIENGGMYASC